MSSETDEIEILKNLGLTLNEAKVYLALCHHGILDVRTVTKCTAVPRQDIYRVMANLNDLGLIEKIISWPTKFRSIPIEKGVSLLLKRKQKQITNLQLKSKLLLKRFQVTNNTKQELEKPRFILTPRRETFVEKVRALTKTAQKSIDVVSSYKRLLKIHLFSDTLENAWSRGVKCRFVMNKPEKSRAATELLKFLTSGSCCHVRFIPHAPETVVSIYDQREILVIADPNVELLESTALWSNSSSLIAGMRDYYNILWMTALEEPKYNTDYKQT
ncbi:MAG: hypothetical protein NWF06_03675 [Candidatus Bathyarchaeota archaeon]|nr:hypothetical protein [Candidatus Bathyarchaeum sp.]